MQGVSGFSGGFPTLEVGGVTAWSKGWVGPHLAPVPTRGGSGRGHLGFLFTFFQFFPSQHHLTGIIAALRAVPVRDTDTVAIS